VCVVIKAHSLSQVLSLLASTKVQILTPEEQYNSANTDTYVVLIEVCMQCITGTQFTSCTRTKLLTQFTTDLTAKTRSCNQLQPELSFYLLY